MTITYIIGHQKPDTDAVVSAMALEYLYKSKDCFGYQNPKAAIIDPLNPETSFLFKKFGIEPPPQISALDLKPEDQVVLVDHNEADQRLAGLNPEQIVEIVDHHKVNLNLNTPLYLNFKPWGSSSSVIYYLMETVDVKPDEKLARLMLSAILSDTVGFKSATCTPKDIEIGQQLAEIAGISDLDALSLEIFKAKSDISSLSDEAIVKNDYKIFDFGKKTFIGQLETVEQESILKNKKSDLLKAMQKIKAAEEVELIFLALTDVLKVNTKLLVLGEAEAKVAQQAFSGSVTDNVLDIGPKLSRKKEIAPPIETAIQ